MAAASGHDPGGDQANDHARRGAPQLARQGPDAGRSGGAPERQRAGGHGGGGRAEEGGRRPCEAQRQGDARRPAEQRPGCGRLPGREPRNDQHQEPARKAEDEHDAEVVAPDERAAADAERAIRPHDGGCPKRDEDGGDRRQRAQPPAIAEHRNDQGSQAREGQEREQAHRWSLWVREMAGSAVGAVVRAARAAQCRRSAADHRDGRGKRDDQDRGRDAGQGRRGAGERGEDQEPRHDEHDQRGAQPEGVARDRDGSDGDGKRREAGGERSVGAQPGQRDGGCADARSEAGCGCADRGREAERGWGAARRAPRGHVDQEAGKDAGDDAERERQRRLQWIGDEGRHDEQADEAQRSRPRVPHSCRNRGPDPDERAGDEQERGHGTEGLGLASPFPIGAG